VEHIIQPFFINYFSFLLNTLEEDLLYFVLVHLETNFLVSFLLEIFVKHM